MHNKINFCGEIGLFFWKKVVYNMVIAKLSYIGVKMIEYEKLGIDEKQNMENIRKMSETNAGQIRKFAERIVGKNEADKSIEEGVQNAINIAYVANPRFIAEFLQQNIRISSFNIFVKRRPFIKDVPEMKEVLADLKKNFPLKVLENPTNHQLVNLPRRVGKVIDDALGHMRPANRDVFVRRYFYVESIEDIAKKYNTTPENINIILENAKEVVVYYLRKGGYYD